MISPSNSTTTSGGRKLPLVVIVGETASGKSGLGLALAQKLKGEIINADSRTIYKGMDIGTSKPTLAEQARVKHHALDMVEPGQPFNAADFKREALKAIAEIRARHHLPIMVGGTGLYVDAVIFDYHFRVRYNEAIRQALEEKSVDELIQLALEQGFDTGDISKNRRHLIRLLEAGPSSDRDRQTMIDAVIIVGLAPPRAELRQNIVTRVEQMFKHGLRREVEDLTEHYSWQSEAMSGIGYREFEEYFHKRASMGEVKRQIVQHTLNLAKRQRTWFKRNPQIKWFATTPEAKQFVLDQIKSVNK